MRKGGPSPSRHTTPPRKRNDAAGKPRGVGGSCGYSGICACVGKSPRDGPGCTSGRHPGPARRMTQSLVDLLLHLDRHLDLLFAQVGIWTYAVVFAIAFAETGLVVTPFLPGDSLLFATGALAARGLISAPLALAPLALAAFSGNAVNYAIGRLIGPRIFNATERRGLAHPLLNRQH